MKITICVPRPRLSLEPELLVRFVIRQLSEISQPDCTEPPPIVLALLLAAVAHDHEFHNHLREWVSSCADNSDEILKMTRDLFLPALGQTLDDPDVAEEYPFPDEQNCKQVLRFAVGEGKRELVERDFEFLRVFEFLTRVGLLCCSYRLAQFAEVCECFRDDPTNLVRRGIEIIEAIISSPVDLN